MKRSPIRRSTTPLKRRRPVRAVSERREAEKALRAAVVALVTARDRTCRAATLVPSVVCRGPLDVHEVIPRSAWRAGYLVAENALLICRAHHQWVDARPADAAEVGLHAFSWQRPDAGAPSALELQDNPKETP